MNVEQAQALFPEALRDLLSFEQQGNYIVIRPRQFLGSENFSEIGRIIRENGGEYISAGKQSHFRITMGSAPTQEKASASSVPEKAPLPPLTTLHFKVAKLTVALGTTVQNSETEWTKQSYGLEVEVNSDVIDIVEKAKAEAEQLVKAWLTQPQLSPLHSADLPQFDPEELMKHEWKGKKTGEGTYAKGSTAWGWDFKDKFPESVIKVLEKGPIEIDQYTFTLERTLVQAKKKKT
jgi:hypothetical protein